MFFNSFDFAFFLLLVLGVYYLLPWRGQNVFLLAASYFFYGCWDWRFLGLLLLSTLVDYGIGSKLSRCDDPKRRRRLLLLSLSVNLGVLGFFKYFDFFAESLTDLMGMLGLSTSPLLLDIILPVGISFYTFQTLSYTIDIYRGKLEPTRNLLDFALFVSFFPQLVAGPIERASRFLPQIAKPRSLTWTAVRSGAWLIAWGIFKKVYVADNISQIADVIFDPRSKPVSLELLLGMYAFAVQVYCDFSGYTDVARGVARLLGFELMLNFRLPYFASSPRDVWMRWHISLSTWLRDYVFIPLGGSRGSSWMLYRNLLLTMIIGGLWHGAAWTYVAWGALHGGFLVVQRLLEPLLLRLAPKGRLGARVWTLAGILLTFHLWCFALIYFRSSSLEQALGLTQVLFTNHGVGLSLKWLPVFALFAGPLLCIQLWQGLSANLDVVLHSPFVVRVLVYSSLLVGLLLFGEDHGQPFIYFQF